jgi:hypothetical protein
MWGLRQAFSHWRIGAQPSTAPARVHLLLPGWTMTRSDARRAVWRDGVGDAVILTVQGDIPVPLSDDRALRRFSRQIAESRGGGLIEAAAVMGPDGPGVRFIYKRFEGNASWFTGMLVTRVPSASWVWTVVAGEQGMTGIREVVVAARLMNTGALTRENYEARWAADPYEPTYAGVDHRRLRSLADDESYDGDFPGHPLSKARRLLREIPGHFGVSPSRRRLDHRDERRAA